MLGKLAKYLPNKEKLQKENELGWLGKRLHRPELWEFNHHYIAKGTAFGLFAAFIPLPGQTLVAVLLSYLFRANMPIAIAMTWITNPLTFVPINYAIYKIGHWVMNDFTPYHQMTKFHWQGNNMFELMGQLKQWLGFVGKPFLVGTIFMALTAALAGYLLVYICWQISMIWQKEK